MTKEMFGELVRYRGLLGMLAWRDIRVRYKQSIMGIAWAFMMPLIQTMVLYSIFTFGPVRIGREQTLGVPYLLFVLSGVIPWTFFAGAVGMSVESLTRNSRLVTKIYFPREVFPLGSVLASLVDFGIAMLVFIPFYIYYAWHGDVRPGPALLMFPVVVLIQAIFIAGLSLVLSMANLFFRDVKYIMTFVLQLWFFATNVMYPIQFKDHPRLQWLAYANPMIPIFDAYRDIVMGRMPHNSLGLVLSTVIALAVAMLGWRMFHKAEFKFAEYV